MLVDRETDGAAVVKGVEHAAVSQVIGEMTLLKHMAGEGSEDKMESFVEEHEVRSFFIQKYASLQKY